MPAVGVACPSPPCLQDIPVLVSLPSPLPEGVPDEQQYIQAYCTARGLPYPLQASMQQGPSEQPGLLCWLRVTGLI